MQDHLNDTTTYKSLMPSETERYASEIWKNILAWLKTPSQKLTKMECAFIWDELNKNRSPYAQFYLTLKAHKLKPGQNEDNLRSRHIVSCPGSLLHGLGVWVDRKLQEVAQKNFLLQKNVGTKTTATSPTPTP